MLAPTLLALGCWFRRGRVEDVFPNAGVAREFYRRDAMPQPEKHAKAEMTSGRHDWVRLEIAAILRSNVSGRGTRDSV